jgi:hypothetical protein
MRRYSRNNSGDGVWTLLVVIVVLIVGVSWLQQTFWGEREGTIKTDDCRTRVLLKEDSPTTWFKQACIGKLRKELLSQVFAKP